jgi:hypothetical protein
MKIGVNIKPLEQTAKPYFLITCNKQELGSRAMFWNRGNISATFFWNLNSNM